MPVQQLTEVQRKYINETVRPAIDRLIAFRKEMESLVLEMDNQQQPITASDDELGDAQGGASPRSDAPTLTGNDVQSLRNILANMRDQITDVQLNAMISRAVRDLPTIVGSIR